MTTFGAALSLRSSSVVPAAAASGSGRCGRCPVALDRRGVHGRRLRDRSGPGVGRLDHGRCGHVRRQLPERAAVLVLAAGLQESKLVNLAAATATATPSVCCSSVPRRAGAPGPQQLQDLHFGHRRLPRRADQDRRVADDATGRRDPGGADLRRREPLRPARGRGQALSDALTGHAPAGITCTFPKPTTSHRRGRSPR